MNYRIEHDSMGDIQVEASRKWGAQTQRSVENFKIGTEKMPKEIIAAFGVLKRACAEVNGALGKLDPQKSAAIQAACDEVLSGACPEEFPSTVYTRPPFTYRTSPT